ncbi:MAG: YbjN domain-containing protein [Clostridia bacterium]|nr:YbjN domain-containing protein [Clostridia bacterium]
MLACAELFARDLEAKELHFSVSQTDDGGDIIKFPYDNRMTTCIFKGEDGRYLSMYTVVERVPADKLSDMYAVCNAINARYKWLKFYVDEDNDLMVEDDAILSVESAAEESFELLMRRLNIMKETKAEIMRVIYS